MTDPSVQTPEQREAELRWAGWGWLAVCQRDDWPCFAWFMEAPDGRLFADAYGAWCVMRQEADNAK
jgi:hypothetical protein